MRRVDLSAPLPVEGLVSHYLTNYLIGHKPLRGRQLAPPLVGRSCDSPTLLGINGTFAKGVATRRYSHAKGTLPMYYAPVRHSPRLGYPYLSPFDLHALATPPAFTLSQDQTLQFNPVNSSATEVDSGGIYKKAQNF
jgi:hypothetical protein